MAKQKRPHGTWSSPITPSTMSGDYRLYDAQWDTDSDALVWQERRSGGSALVVQSGGENPRDLLRDESVGGRILFGGGGFSVRGKTIYYAGKDGRLYRLPLAGGLPQAVTPAFGQVAAPTPSPDGEWLLYVHSYEGRDALAAVPADGGQYPRKLLDDTDFIMHPAWHPDGGRVACITWNHPHMPWNETQLQLLDVDATDAGLAVTGRDVIAGADGGESVFGAAFSPDGRYLAYASDCAGWWQLYVYDLESGDHTQLTDDAAEYALPAWLQDMRTFAWSPDGAALYALRTQGGVYSLQRVDVPGGEQQTVGGLEAYTHLEQLAVSSVTGDISVIAGNPTTPDCIVTVDPATEQVRVRAESSINAIPADYLSSGETVEWGKRERRDG